MKLPICSRCKKNIAVVFVTKIENGVTKNEGLCLKCAKELGIKPVSDMMDRFGINDKDLDELDRQLSEGDGEMIQNIINSIRPMPSASPDGDEEEHDPSESGRAPGGGIFRE